METEVTRRMFVATAAAVAAAKGDRVLIVRGMEDFGVIRKA